MNRLIVSVFGVIICSSYSSAVTGGDDAQIETYPYHVALHGLFGYQCGGALLTPEWVLTSAHCVNLQILIGGVIMAGTNQINGSTENAQTRSIDLLNIAIHPQFIQGDITNDIALVRLTSPFELSSAVQTIRISKFPCLSDVVPLILTGFGLTDYQDDQGVPATFLQVGSLTKLPYADCQSKLTDDVVLDANSHICTIGNVGPCILDQGSPMVQDGQLVGIFSWLTGACSTEYKPVIYTRVVKHLDWIKSVIGNLP